MNCFIRCYKFLKFSAVRQPGKTALYVHLLRNPKLFSTSISSVDDDRKKKPLPKSVITSTCIAELLKSSCGFLPEEAEALESRLLASVVMRKKQPKIIENATNVIEFFRDAGFSDTHIRKVISLKPRVLSSSVEETLKPKFRPFEDLGLSSPEIRDFMINNVLYLRRSGDSTIAVLSTLFESKEDVARVIMKNRFPPTWTCRRNLDTQISKYLEHGVSKEKLVRFLANEPSLIMIRAELIEERIQKAYKMGFKYGDSLLMAAVKVIGSMNESTLESKFQVLRSYGWEESEIYMAFQRSPWFLAISVEKMRRTLKFFMEDLKYEPFDLASRPAVFNLSFDKRILPRYNFIKDLESSGIQKRKYNLLTFIRLTERRFQEVFLLDIKDEHPELFKSYLKSIGQD